MATYTIREGLDGASVPDSYMVSTAADTNYGNVGTIAVGYAEPPKIGATIYRSILEFDTSVIPAGATITSALLRLYCNGGAPSNETAYVRRCTGNGTPPFQQQTPDWVETEVTWNDIKAEVAWTSAGGNYTTADQSLFRLPLSTGDFDITGLKALVEDAIATRCNELHLLLMRNVEASPIAVVTCSSGEHATAVQRPRLIVETTIATAHLVAVDGCAVRSAGHFATVG